MGCLNVLPIKTVNVQIPKKRSAGMKNRLLALIILVVLTSWATKLCAQQPSDSTSRRQDSSLVKLDSVSLERELTKLFVRTFAEVSFSYLSNNVYLGRKDSDALPYFIPAFAFYHKSGIFLGASLGYLKSSTLSRVDQVTLDGGYIFQIGRYDGAITASKYFYNSQSTNVKSQIAASLVYQSGYDFGIIKPTFSGTLNVSNAFDFEGAFGLEHQFNALHNNLSIIPSLVINAGTENFFNDYYKKKRFSIKRKGRKPLQGVATISGEVIDPGAFKVLDYEASLFIYYRIGKFSFNFSPTYAVPVDPSEIYIHEVFTSNLVRNKIITEKLENTFYWLAAIAYKF